MYTLIEKVDLHILVYTVPIFIFFVLNTVLFMYFAFCNHTNGRCLQLRHLPSYLKLILSLY
jgi:hypothetical protein